MQTSQHLNKSKYFLKATSRQRGIAAIVCVAITALFVILIFAAKGKIDIGKLLGPCGFRQQYDLPCPTCGITTSSILFVQGRIVESFYTQPVGALLCFLLVISVFLAFFITVSGVYLRFLQRLFAWIKAKYIILAMIILILAVWIVKLIQAKAG